MRGATGRELTGKSTLERKLLAELSQSGVSARAKLDEKSKRKESRGKFILALS